MLRLFQFSSYLQNVEALIEQSSGSSILFPEYVHAVPGYVGQRLLGVIEAGCGSLADSCGSRAFSTVAFRSHGVRLPFAGESSSPLLHARMLPPRAEWFLLSPLTITNYQRCYKHSLHAPKPRLEGIAECR